MSMEVDNLHLYTPRKSKKDEDQLKHKKKPTEKSEKKRKGRTSDAPDCSFPTKKKRHGHGPNSSSRQVDPKRPAVSPETSPFYERSYSLYLPLAPIAQRHPIQGLCAEHLSPLILSYYPPFHGIIISYTNPRCSSTPENPITADGRQKGYARSINEYAASFVWLTAEFLIFDPRKGDVIEGYINLQNENSIGLVCWNFFSASIERKRLPSDWRWISGGTSAGNRKEKLKGASLDGGVDVDQEDRKEEDQSNEVEDAEGHFQDGNGTRVGGLVQFTVETVDTSGSMYRENSFLTIHGSMLDEDEEACIRPKNGSNVPGRMYRRSAVDGEETHVMAGALTNGHDGAMDIDNMPFEKHKAKHGLPPANVLWTVRPLTVAAGAGTTISQFLEQVNDVIPLEADEWGLEDYAVEVNGFECLHFSELHQVLNEDDEVCIRPLQTADLRVRKISGRHQITDDGKHLIDGVAFGRPFLRKAARPAIHIPPRKRRCLTYCEDDEDVRAMQTSDRQAVVRARFEDVDRLGSEEDDEEDGDFAPENEAGLVKELEWLQEDHDAREGAQAALRDRGASRRRTRSQRSPQGLGILRLVDEDGRPFPGTYKNPLLDLYSQDEPLHRTSGPKVRKRGQALGNRFLKLGTKSYLQGSSATPETPGGRDSTGSNKSVRFEDVAQATPVTVRESKSSDDEGDGGFEREMNESDKENADPQAHEEDLGEEEGDSSDASSSTFSESDPSDNDDTSSSGSSSSDSDLNSESESGSEPEELRSSGPGHKGNISESSSSDTSSSSSDSDLKAKDNRKKFCVTPNTSVDEIQATPLEKPQPMKPPGTGKKDTRKRNQRRKDSLALKKLIRKGDLPAGATKVDLQKVREARKASTAHANNERQEALKTSNADSASIEAKRYALLESIASGEVAVGHDSPEVKVALRQHEESAALRGGDDPPTAVKDQHPSGTPMARTSKEQEMPFPIVQILDSNPEQPPTKTTEPVRDSSSTVMVEESEKVAKDASDAEKAAESREFAKAVDGHSSATPESQPRRSKLNLASSKRLLFGSLGLRTPKSKEDASSLRAKLMKDTKPLKQPSANVHVGKKLVDIDDEGWKDKIDLKAVECCYEGVELSTPPFPFVQRWDPQQQRGYRPPNSRQRAKEKKRKRNDSSYYGNQYDVSFNNGTQNKSSRRFDYEPPASQLEWEAEARVQRHGDEEATSMPSHIVQDAQATSNQVAQDTADSADKAQAATEEDVLPTLPADLSTYATLTKKDCKPGTVIAFKKFEMSLANGWQPYISQHRTAVVNRMLNDDTLQMTWAKRDQPDQQKRYDSETGDRIYGKFEMPGYDDDDENSDPSKVSIVFTELIEPKLIRKAEDRPRARDTSEGERRDAPDDAYEKEGGRTNDKTKDLVQDQGAHELHDDTKGQQDQSQNDSDKSVARYGADRPGRPLHQGIDGATADIIDAPSAKQPSTQARQEISEIFRNAGWRSSVGSNFNQQLDGLEEPGSERKDPNHEETKSVDAPSPKFNGFSSPRYSETSSPLRGLSHEKRAVQDEIAESVPPPAFEEADVPASDVKTNVTVDYPSLPHLEEDSETFHSQRQHRSVSVEADESCASPDLVSPPSLRRKRQQRSPSPASKSQVKGEIKVISTLDGADSDSEEFPTLFSQAFDSRLSQEIEIKRECSQGSSMSPLPKPRSKPKLKINSKRTAQCSPRSSTQERTPRWAYDEEAYGMNTLRASQPSQIQQSSQIVDLTISSDSIAQDNTFDDGDDSYRPSSPMPKGSGWVAKAHGTKGSAAKAAGRRKTTSS
ncbi:MAG: hypothetical protein Q9217_000010 [Psora testacea]